MMSAQILPHGTSSDRSPRDKRYDLLFEPVQIAAPRGMKAEGGWAVVCTEHCSIHPTSDDSPHAYASLWNREDIANHLE